MIDRGFVSPAPASMDQPTSIEQRLDGTCSPVDIAVVFRRMKSNHIDNFIIRHDPGWQTDSYIFDKHKKSVKNVIR